jgi:hypothetical protein
MIKVNLDKCEVIPASKVAGLGPYRSATEFYTRREPVKDGDLVLMKGKKGRRQLRSVTLIDQAAILSGLELSVRPVWVPMAPMDRVIVTTYF